MKTAVSVSLGSSQRDKEAEIVLLGEAVCLRREGYDGDKRKVRARFAELDGEVDALGAGGVDLWVGTDELRYPLHDAQRLVYDVRQTPVVDGGGLKNTLERHVVRELVASLGEEWRSGKRVLVVSAVDRYGMAASFFEAGYEVICGDLGFGLGLPIPVRSEKGVARMAKLLLPFVGYLPMGFLYPTGKKQHENHPKFESWYAWADVIAGDCHFIRQHMPRNLQGKVVVTSTTTAADRAAFAERGVRHVMTTTPIIEGRSFGTNLLEAGITAVAGKQRPLTTDELNELLPQLSLQPMLSPLE